MASASNPSSLPDLIDSSPIQRPLDGVAYQKRSSRPPAAIPALAGIVSPSRWAGPAQPSACSGRPGSPRSGRGWVSLACAAIADDAATQPTLAATIVANPIPGRALAALHEERGARMRATGSDVGPWTAPGNLHRRGRQAMVKSPFEKAASWRISPWIMTRPARIPYRTD